MENIMKPEPHKIVSVIRQTAAEFTIRVACDKDPDMDSFSSCLCRKSERRRSLSVEKDRVMWNLPSVKSDD